ncbi:tRNA (adenosine(37)-N6)-threonylcarbamoyltransferase complex ATPase subunit type 1 TsaE [Halieaceae bacterium IMCC14734]|uniref:tRNA threonylcarbamoyladenosine biosynthesis protein TsaE n=1 Tax=Candidatus Litorirhabdus singularis TaxID=2518993 RepID=A0ABT3TLZ0_9GAMM|nr:tRNA (adenosine(37)-N6)-threonylcarbamoyltransferase complex ATPase subunit type 1 TsaE [Candidatus Litorirhabdus singularis]MCX2982726.1 tRNA (adenosine(37)-N6)-threonylcarbamoyltransferase complex ATPase subunit type 1 TsaE [Candidatus Litorirhabdus singularis]
MSTEKSLSAPDEAAMLALGARLYEALDVGSVVYLKGELGMGKTTLSRGIVQAAGHTGAVKSPTYTLVEPYQLAEGTLYHFDLYRLGDAEELEFMGIRDYFIDFRLALIEWPERGAGFLPPADLVVTIQPELPGRRLHLQAQSPQGRACLQRLAL